MGELHAEGRNYIGSFVVTGTVEIADGIGRAHCKKLYTRFAQVKRVRQPKRKYGEGYEAGSASAKAKSSVTASSRLQPAYADGPPTKKIKDEASIRKPEEEES